MNEPKGPETPQSAIQEFCRQIIAILNCGDNPRIIVDKIIRWKNRTLPLIENAVGDKEAEKFLECAEVPSASGPENTIRRWREELNVFFKSLLDDMKDNPQEYQKFHNKKGIGHKIPLSVPKLSAVKIKDHPMSFVAKMQDASSALPKIFSTSETGGAVVNSAQINFKHNHLTRRFQVFVSSTFLDLKIERQAAVEAILASGHIPAGMELFPAGDDTQWEHIRTWIRESDIYMLILGGRYGSIEQSSGKSYSQLEYEYAIELGKPIFSIFLSDEYIARKKMAFQSMVDENISDRFRSFRELARKKMIKEVSDIGAIQYATSLSLQQMSKRPDMEGWVSWREIKELIK